jgi:hypothetical protein
MAGEMSWLGAAGLPPPAARPVPRVITFQRKRANRRVINEEQLLSLLSAYGTVSAALCVALHRLPRHPGCNDLPSWRS